MDAWQQKYEETENRRIREVASLLLRIQRLEKQCYLAARNDDCLQTQCIANIEINGSPVAAPQGPSRVIVNMDLEEEEVEDQVLNQTVISESKPNEIVHTKTSPPTDNGMRMTASEGDMSPHCGDEEVISEVQGEKASHSSRCQWNDALDLFSSFSGSWTERREIVDLISSTNSVGTTDPTAFPAPIRDHEVISIHDSVESMPWSESEDSVVRYKRENYFDLTVKGLCDTIDKEEKSEKNSASTSSYSPSGKGLGKNEMVLRPRPTKQRLLKPYQHRVFIRKKFMKCEEMEPGLYPHVIDLTGENEVLQCIARPKMSVKLENVRVKQEYSLRDERSAFINAMENKYSEDISW